MLEGESADRLARVEVPMESVELSHANIRREVSEVASLVGRNTRDQGSKGQGSDNRDFDHFELCVLDQKSKRL